MKRLFLMTASLSTAACTSLQVHPVDVGNSFSRIGIPYEIPMTQYEIVLEYAIEKCAPTQELSVTAKIAETLMAPDPEHRYAIDPDSLQSIFKTSNVKAEFYANGSIKSLNATAEDKTGEIIANVGSIAVKVAKLAAGGGGPNAADNCSDETKQALGKIEKLKPEIEVANTRLEDATETLKSLREKMAALGNTQDAATANSLSKAYDDLVAATKAQKALLTTFDKAKKVISYKRTEYWPNKGSETSTSFAFPRAVALLWLKKLDDDPRATETLDVYLLLKPLVAFLPTARSKGAPSTGIEPGGIPYRKPENGILSICSKAECGKDKSETLAEQKGLVHQLGLVYYLQCKSRPFTSISCALEFTEDGHLKLVGSEQKEAALAGGTKALDGLLGNASSISEALKKDPDADTKTMTAHLKAEAEHQAAIKALEVMPESASQTEIKALKEQSDLAKARLMLIEANEALADRQK